ncbi:hypothetical protein J0H58_20360 [bacterium]|nr:hypothetical protein [bacterium]
MSILSVLTKLEYESGSGWAEIDRLKSVNFPQFSISQIDTTHLGVTDYGKTFMPGMIDPGTITFTCAFSENTYTALQGLIRDVLGWRVTAPTGDDVAVTCDGFLSALDVTVGGADEEMTITGTVKMTGVPVVS